MKFPQINVSLSVTKNAITCVRSGSKTNNFPTPNNGTEAAKCAYAYQIVIFSCKKYLDII